MWQINGIQASLSLSLSPVYTKQTVWANSVLFWGAENENKPQRMETSDKWWNEMTAAAGGFTWEN